MLSGDHFPQNVGGELGIERRGLELLVPEQDLDQVDIDLLLQPVFRENLGLNWHGEALNSSPSLRIIFSSGYGDVVDDTLLALSLP